MNILSRYIARHALSQITLLIPHFFVKFPLFTVRIFSKRLLLLRVHEIYYFGLGLVQRLNPGEGSPYNGLYGEALPERGIFFKLQVYERVGISLVEVYKRVGKSVIWVCERAQKG